MVDAYDRQIIPEEIGEDERDTKNRKCDFEREDSFRPAKWWIFDLGVSSSSDRNILMFFLFFFFFFSFFRSMIWGEAKRREDDFNECFF